MKQFISFVMALVMFAIIPLETAAQTAVTEKVVLSQGTRVQLRTIEMVLGDDDSSGGMLSAVVANDVYDENGQVAIKAGAKATLAYTVEGNGAFGKAAKLYLTSGNTKAINNVNVPLMVNFSKKGGGKIGLIITLSLLFFPIGLVSLLIKGGKATVKSGVVIDTMVASDVVISK